MTKRIPFSYAVLRYVHDITTGEFVNIGLVFYAADVSYFRYSLKTTTKRISDFFPGVKALSFKALIRPLRKRLEVVGESLKPGLFTSAVDRLDSVLSSILPKDDSSIVWSGISYGAAADLDGAFDKIFARHVTRFDQKSINHGRSDDDVWRAFRRDLEKRNVLGHFEPKVIASADDEVEFPFAWKNGIWHCVEPISFDLSGSDTMRDKAHRFLGQLMSVSESPERFKVYFLVGKPAQQNLGEAFDKALRILEKLPGEKEIYTEDQSDLLADKLSEQIRAHPH